MTAFADSSQVELGLVAESVWGVTPTSPAPVFSLTRFTGESLGINRENIQSQEIRPDRNVADLIQVGGGASGGLNFELSYGTFDAMLESLLANTWSTSPANILKNGSTQKSFSIQKKVETGATDVFFLYKGMVVDSMSLNIAPGAIVTGAFNLIGLGGVVSNSATGTNSAANTKAVMNAASHIVLTTVGVSPLPSLRSMSLNISNGLRARKVVGSVNAAGIGMGQFNVTGSFEAYFENKALFDLFLAGSSGGIQFTVGGTTLEKYTFKIPTIKISNSRVVAGGNNQDMVVACDFQGLYNSGIGATLEIDRAVA